LECFCERKNYFLQHADMTGETSATQIQIQIQADIEKKYADIVARICELEAQLAAVTHALQCVVRHLQHNPGGDFHL
jgi:hypothetical protein